MEHEHHDKHLEHHSDSNKVLRAVFHQLSTDSELETCTGATRYAALLVEIGIHLCAFDDNFEQDVGPSMIQRLNATHTQLALGGDWRSALGWNQPTMLDKHPEAWILAGVLKAMDEAEEMGGPEGDDYPALMERIASEARRRAATYRANQAISESPSP